MSKSDQDDLYNLEDSETLDETQLRYLLEELRFTQDLPSDVLQQLADEVRMIRVPSGATLFREGSPCETIYLIVSGHFVLGMNVPGRGTVPILTVGKGEMFGWSSLLRTGRMTTNAVATEDTTCLVARGAKLAELCEANHTFGYYLMRRMAAAISDRLVATRLQLLDMFADPA